MCVKHIHVHVECYNFAAVGGAISRREFAAASQTQVAVPAEGEEVPLDIAVFGRNWITYTLFRWPNGRVPYTIDVAFSPKERLIIAQALSELEDKSCIKFSEKTGSDQDFVHIYTTTGSGCFAFDHYRKGLGQHGIHLARPGCMVGTRNMSYMGQAICDAFWK